jgi:hypothetical protein
MSNKNESKNEMPGKQFTSKYQPSPEAKSKGWDKRREALEILEEIMSKEKMTLQELGDLMDDFEKNPEKHTVREWKIVTYLKDKKLVLDWLDRKLGKAEQSIDLTSKGQKLTAGIFIDDPEED